MPAAWCWKRMSSPERPIVCRPARRSFGAPSSAPVLSPWSAIPSTRAARRRCGPCERYETVILLSLGLPALKPIRRNHAPVRKDPMKVELSRFRVKSGKSGRVDEWLKMLNRNMGEIIPMLDREEMKLEVIFREMIGEEEYLYWFSVQAD